MHGAAQRLARCCGVCGMVNAVRLRGCSVAARRAVCRVACGGRVLRRAPCGLRRCSAALAARLLHAPWSAAQQPLSCATARPPRCRRCRRRHNELRPRTVLTPALPAWKPADDEDEDERLGVGYSSMPAPAQVGVRRARRAARLLQRLGVHPAAAAGCCGSCLLPSVRRAAGAPLHAANGAPHARAPASPRVRLRVQGGRVSHADKVGEPVCLEEGRHVLACVFDSIIGQVRRQGGGRQGRACDGAVAQRRQWRR